MSAVVRTDEWPRRAETVARSTPSASRRLAWLCRSTWSDAPLGRPSLRQSRDNTRGDARAEFPLLEQNELAMLVGNSRGALSRTPNRLHCALRNALRIVQLPAEFTV